MRSSQASVCGIESTCSILPCKTRVCVAEFTRAAEYLPGSQPGRNPIETNLLLEQSFPFGYPLIGTLPRRARTPPISAPDNPRKLFEGYLLNVRKKRSPPHPSGAFGFSYGWRTIAEAEARAIENCIGCTSCGVSCRLAMVDDEKTRNE
jgi:hypothetical protein